MTNAMPVYVIQSQYKWQPTVENKYNNVAIK